MIQYQPTNSADYQVVTAPTTSKAMSIVSFVFSAIALLVIPLFFGAIAAGFAGVGLSKGEGTIAKWALGVAVANLLYGAVALLIAMNQIQQYSNGF